MRKANSQRKGRLPMTEHSCSDNASIGSLTIFIHHPKTKRNQTENLAKKVIKFHAESEDIYVFAGSDAISNRGLAEELNSTQEE